MNSQSKSDIHTVQRKRPANFWRAVMLLIALIISLPVLVVVSSLFQPTTPAWQHLLDTLLTDYILNSFLLMIGVGLGTFILGVSSAWVVTSYEFPGRRWLQWGLLLPLAVPAYIIAYTYTGLLDFAGPVQTNLRELFGWQYGDYWFPNVRSLPGAILMFSLVLYPYVYLIVRSSFLEQSRAVLEVSRSLGYGMWHTFFKVALPLARPAIVAGITIALMETLSDYGTVEYFGVATFTTGIIRTWFGLGDLQAAIQLSSLLLMFVFSLILVELWSRRKMRFHHTGHVSKQNRRIKASGFSAVLCVLICLIPLLFGFIVPALQLVSWTIETSARMLNQDFIELVLNSFLLASVSALCCLLIAVILCYGKRISKGYFAAFSVRVASMGYAIPGVVIAVGILLPLSWLDKSIDHLANQWFNTSTGLLLSGTLFALVFAYVVRFLAIATQTLDSGLTKISSSIDESARSLGHKPWSILFRVHLPMLRVSLFTALLLVFVDVLKELPTTLILRPFNFNTLAVRTYELASDERLADASSAALAIVAIAIAPIILIINNMKKDSIGDPLS